MILFLKDLSLGKVNQGRKIGEARQLKYLDILEPSLIYFKKPASKITLRDMEKFDLDLSKNEIKRPDGKVYSEETKSEIKRLLKVYLKWKLKGKPALFAELTSWVDTRVAKNKTPEFLSEEEVIQLYKACKSAKERFLIAVLFDSGARAEELRKEVNAKTNLKLSLREMSRHLTTFAKRGFVKCLTPDAPYGRLYVLTEAGKRIKDLLNK